MRGPEGPRIPVAIVDPHTLLGRDVKAVLEERAFPISKTHLFHTQNVGSGLLTEGDDEATYVALAEPGALDLSRIAFLCGSPEGTARFLKTRSPSDGCIAIDLSGAAAPVAPPVPGYAPVPGPFVVPEDDTAPLPPGGLLRLHDPTAVVVADLLKRLSTAAGSPLAGATVAVDRPVSELGKAALSELFEQALALATFRPIPKEILGTQVAFNMHVPADTPAYEARVEREIRTLLGADGELPLTILSVRGGTFHGHLIRIEARFSTPVPDEATLRAALFQKGSPLEDVDPENLSGPVESAARDETLVLRIASHSGEARGRITITAASDHLRRAGALAAVKTAERLLAKL